MTDKELIKQEIERRIKNLSLILNIGNTEDLTKEEEYGYCVEQETLNSLPFFINSFPESPSPKFKIGNTIRDKEGKTGAFTITDIKVEDKSLVYLGNNRQKVSIWCQDDYEIVNNDLLVKENPASEDLEEEIQRAYYDKSLYDADNIDRTDFNCIARHFAEWQKQKDLEDSLKSDLTMPNKFYEKGKADAMNEMKETLQTEYEKGRFDMQEENTSNNTYWQSFRAEAAKDILAGMMQHKVLSDSSMTLFVPKEQVVSAAIGLADELIKQLKEKEEK